VQKAGVGLMAYSPLLGGAYIKNDLPMPIQYCSDVGEFKLSKLTEVAIELNISPNAVVLAWMKQSSPSVIPLISASYVDQRKENFQGLSLKLSETELE
jgi:aryl-alcohol dehydrogenase-like predicted oxidoreductase